MLIPRCEKCHERHGIRPDAEYTGSIWRALPHLQRNTRGRITVNKIANRLFYAGLDKDAFYRVMPQARLENEGKLKTYALITLGMFLLLSLLNYTLGVFPSGTTLCYLSIALFSAAVYGLMRILPSRNPTATTTLCYTFLAALYAFSIILSVIHPELPAVTAIAVMLMGPFLFTERPIHLIGMNAAAIVLLCVLSLHCKSRALALIDIWNAFAFGIISIMAEINQECIRFRLLYNTDRITYLSETDLLTGCKNRNCFQERLSVYPEKCRESLVCVYIDVNGLHDLNDRCGHEAGDIMLQAAARALLETFDPEHTYRTGGDEFVVLRMDADKEDTRKKIEQVKAALSAQGYDISAGIETAGKTGLDLNELCKQAELHMYEEKEAYYAQSSRDRRKR